MILIWGKFKRILHSREIYVEQYILELRVKLKENNRNSHLSKAQFNDPQL